MLAIALMVAVLIGAFAGLWGLLHFTDQITRRAPFRGANGAPAPRPPRIYR